MTGDAAASIQTIELCIVQNTDDAWKDFLASVEELVRKAFFAHGGKADFEEFKAWFSGWLYSERKLHAAYRALMAKVDAGECSTPELQANYFNNYFANVVRSAVSEFYKEKRHKGEALQDPETMDAHPAKEEGEDSREERQKRLRSALRQLEPDLRIPFWLRYYHGCGPLEDVDLQWISASTGQHALKIRNAIQDHAVRNAGKKYPLSSAFIGEMLDLPPSFGSGYAAVDQRVRRALVRIKEIVAESAEEEA